MFAVTPDYFARSWSEDGELNWELSLVSAPYDLAISPDRRFALTGSATGQLNLIDLRERTNRVLVAYEDNRSYGWGAEIASRIADELFEHLDAPVKRLGALDTFVGYAPVLEDTILPQVDDIVDLAREAARY